MTDNGIKPVKQSQYTTYSNLGNEDAFKVGDVSRQPKQEFKKLLGISTEPEKGTPISLRDEMIDPQSMLQYLDDKPPSVAQAKAAGAFDITTEQEALSEWGRLAIWNSNSLQIATETHAELTADLQKALDAAEDPEKDFEDLINKIQADLDYALAERQKLEANGAAEGGVGAANDTYQAGSVK